MINFFLTKITQFSQINYDFSYKKISRGFTNEIDFSRKPIGRNDV